MLYIAMFPVKFCNHLDREERAGCCALFVFLVSCDCYVTLTHGAVGCFAVCNCGIFRSYSFVFCSWSTHLCMELNMHINEPVLEISNNEVCATSKASDQPAHTRSLIRTFASRLSIL